MRRLVQVGVFVYAALLLASLWYLVPKLNRARHEGWGSDWTPSGVVVTAAEPATVKSAAVETAKTGMGEPAVTPAPAAST